MTETELETIIRQTLDEIVGDAEELTSDQVTQVIRQVSKKINVSPLQLLIAFTQSWGRNHANN